MRLGQFSRSHFSCKPWCRRLLGRLHPLPHHSGAWVRQNKAPPSTRERRGHRPHQPPTRTEAVMHEPTPEGICTGAGSQTVRNACEVEEERRVLVVRSGEGSPIWGLRPNRRESHHSPRKLSVFFQGELSLWHQLRRLQLALPSL